VPAGPWQGSERDIQGRLHELMEPVNLAPEFLTRFPYEFSGGQRPRIGIARATALSPSMIVADEPVSALDVSVQAQIVTHLRPPAVLRDERDVGRFHGALRRRTLARNPNFRGIVQHGYLNH
jgi:ABC-type dipeptide/oligopeptide/nickel transport system ATPase subunit